MVTVEIEYLDRPGTERVEAQWAHVRDMCLMYRPVGGPDEVTVGIPILRINRFRIVEAPRFTASAPPVYGSGETAAYRHFPKVV